MLEDYSALHAEADRLQGVLDNLNSLGHLSVDWTVGRVRFGEGLARLYGMRPGEAWQGFNIGAADKLIVPEDVDWLKSLRGDSLGDSRKRNLEFRVMGADGRLVWIQKHVRVNIDRYGVPLGETGIVFDVTSFKQSGDTLQTSPNAPLHHALHHLADGLVLAARAARQIGLLSLEGRLRSMLVQVGRMLARSIAPPKKDQT